MYKDFGVENWSINRFDNKTKKRKKSLYTSDCVKQKRYTITEIQDIVIKAEKKRRKKLSKKNSFISRMVNMFK